MTDRKERKQLVSLSSLCLSSLRFSVSLSLSPRSDSMKKQSSLMDDTYPANLKSNISKEPLPRAETEKKRKLAQKVVVTVKTEASNKKQKNEGPPSDCWSWRKYGQKPIKGSPYPRGYYRCSTSKGCSAKKQVERCRTDPSVLIVTYTSSHNHAGPDLLEKKEEEFKGRSSALAEDQHHPTTTAKQEREEEEEPEREQKKGSQEDHFQYCQSPFGGSQDITIINGEDNPFGEDRETAYESPPSSLVIEKCPSYPHLTTFSAPKSEENDFYDELEELPTSSFFSSFIRRNFFEERILVNPS